ncbi:MAG: hypothetical protein GY722_06150 [bacterium]|nr:hypothetical protein [bacterium]
MYVRIAVFLAIVLVSAHSGSAGKLHSHSTALWSLSYVSEQVDGGDRQGTKFGIVFLDDGHPPPIYNSITAEYLTGRQTRIARVHTGLSLFAAYPLERRYAVAFRPIVGIENVDTKGESGWAGVFGAGFDFIFRPSYKTQLSLEFNRLDGNRSGTHSQYGVSLRYALPARGRAR